MKVLGDVGPYYVTWLLLTIFRIDVSFSLFHIFDNSNQFFNIEKLKLQSADIPHNHDLCI